MFRFRLVALTALVGVLFPQAGFSQPKKPVVRGFARTATPELKGQEIVANPQLWVFEVTYKKVRHEDVTVTNPKTKQKEKKRVWYLVWKAVRREVPRPARDETEPTNVKDPQPVPLFVPDFTMVITNPIGVKSRRDEIIPEARAAIAKVERIPDDKLWDCVNVVRPLPTAQKTGDEGAFYGIAMWTNIEPKTDRFEVHMGGFTNAYKVVNRPGQKPLILRRMIVQKFWRPGDEFEAEKSEIVFDPQAPKPIWNYLPDDPIPAAQPMPGG